MLHSAILICRVLHLNDINYYPEQTYQVSIVQAKMWEVRKINLFKVPISMVILTGCIYYDADN